MNVSSQVPEGEGPSIFQRRSYIEVLESDLSKFVAEHYGRPWRMQQQGDMLGQHTYQKIQVTPEGTDFDAPEELERQINHWLSLPHPGTDWLAVMNFEREQYVGADVVLWDLCRCGLIPEGEYLILVWW